MRIHKQTDLGPYADAAGTPLRLHFRWFDRWCRKARLQGMASFQWSINITHKAAGWGLTARSLQGRRLLHASEQPQEETQTWMFRSSCIKFRSRQRSWCPRRTSSLGSQCATNARISATINGVPHELAYSLVVSSIRCLLGIAPCCFLVALLMGTE